MKKFINSNIPFLIICLLFGLFNLIFFVSVDLAALNAGCWLGYVFITLAFILIAACSLGFRLKSKSTMTTIWPLMYVCVGYFGVSLITNIIIMAVNSENVVVPIVLNAVILILSAIVFLLAYKSFSRVADNTQARETRVLALRELSVKVNALTFVTQDDEIKAAVKKLKEDLDYSSSAGTASSASYEQAFVSQIDKINMMIISKAEKEQVLAELETAANLWKARNQMLMAGRVN